MPASLPAPRLRRIAAGASDGPFELVLDCDDLAGRKEHLERIGVRYSEACDAGQPPAAVQLDSGDTGPCRLTLMPAAIGDAVPGNANALAAIEVRTHAPQRLAQHWGNLLQLPVDRSDALPRIALANAVLCFALAVDDQPQGVSAIEL